VAALTGSGSGYFVQVVNMAPSPPLTPIPPESTGGRVPARTRPEFSDETIRQSNASAIFVKLRKMIASDTQATDTILGAIAVAAHSLTGATGAAVAMPRDGVVVCVGRSGETAPELGARLNVDSGISGECLRTGVIMRCDDASRDFHVNAEVCRELGLQSIAVVPLRGQHGRVGVLEAFSNQSYAFTEDKMDILGRLAGLAEAAWARGAVTEAPSTKVREEVRPPEVPLDEEGVAAAQLAPMVEAPAEPPLIAPPRISSAIPLTQVREMLATASVEQPRLPKKWRYAIAAAAALLVLALLSVYGWRAWYRSSVASTAGRPAASASRTPGETESAAPGEGAAGIGLAPTSDIVRPSSRSSSSSLRSIESPTLATTRPAAKSARTLPRQSRRSERSADRATADGGTPGNSVPSGDEIPQIAASSPESAGQSIQSADQSVDLRKALAAVPALPQLGVPISQGTSGGVLVYKVQPLYPAEARRMRVQGNVVIDAMVTAQGQVDDLKLVSGDSMLAAAAMDAVRRWRYTPYLLNGKPIPKQTRITVSFIAPR
jgi:TonB family protein